MSKLSVCECVCVCVCVCMGGGGGLDGVHDREIRTLDLGHPQCFLMLLNMVLF